MKKESLELPSLKRMLSLLGEQVENLRPGSKPNKEAIGSCRAVSTATNSYISGVRLALDASKSRGEKPNANFLQLDEVSDPGA